jgi:hypothetical protein
VTPDDRRSVRLPAPRRRRCPRCSGPAIEMMERSPDDEPAAVCITCGYEFVLGSQPGSGFPHSHALSVALAFLAAGLLMGMLIAILSRVPNAGGWLLILAGVGLVAGMGALEAGYLDGLFPHGGRRPPSSPKA